MTGKDYRIMIHARSLCFSIVIISFCMAFIFLTASHSFAQSADTSGKVKEEMSAPSENNDAETESEKPGKDKGKEAAKETKALEEDKDKEARSEKEEPAENKGKDAQAKTKENPEKDQEKKAEKVKTSVKEYPIFAHGKLIFEVPINWMDELQKPTPDSPPAISFKPKSGNDFQIECADGPGSK